MAADARIRRIGMGQAAVLAVLALGCLPAQAQPRAQASAEASLLVLRLEPRAAAPGPAAPAAASWQLDAPASPGRPAIVVYE
jgi:hypothetical protein